MIEYRTGDILATDAEALVNTVNCVGFMGRGIALQFKKAWPDNFKAYAAACQRQEVQPGRMFVFETGRLTNPRLIVNFPTKRHWRGKSRIEDIDAGLAALGVEIRQRGIRSIAIPPLGAGLGGLDWNEVRAHIEHALGDLDQVKVILFEPHGTPAVGQVVRKGKAPAMTPGRAALVGLMDRYLAGLLDPFVSLLEVHKLMYFMQEAGEPLRLRFAKGPFGPYAENLRHVLHAIEGYYVSGYGTGGDAPDKPLELVPGAVQDAQAKLREQPDSLERFERVSRLVAGFESPFGLELLSTVHWILRREHPGTIDELITRTYDWARRKRQFSPNQIRLAAKILQEKGWGAA
jgi:O-acetyl-ADP-ribose deacetylase (regulator of RNase III)